MRLRRNADTRFRRLQRAVEQGDVGAAQALLFEVARQGRWFLPQGWRAPGDGFPYASHVNSQRAYWARLLGYLGWDQAATLQATVATQAPPPAVAYADVLEIQPMHELATIRPFNRIGPKIADAIGMDVMRMLAEAAVRASFQLTERDTVEHLEKPLQANLELRRLLAAYHDDNARGGAAYLAYQAKARPIEAYLRKVQHETGLGEDPRHTRAPQAWAQVHALTAVRELLGADLIHRSDAPDRLADSIFDATYAVGFACDASKGLGVKDYRSPHGWTVFRKRGGWADQGGAKPSRGCMTVANRVIKAAQLEPALLEIARQITVYG